MRANRDFCSLLINIQFEQDKKCSWDFTCKPSPLAPQLTTQSCNTLQTQHHLQFCTAALYKVYLLHKMCHLLHLRLRILYWYSSPRFMDSFHTLVAITKYSEFWLFCSVLGKNFICVTHLPVDINCSFPVMLESTPTHRLPSSLS